MIINKNEKFVITINRQIGSGCLEISEKLSKLLNVNIFNRTVLDEATKRLNITEDQAHNLELSSPSWWEDFSDFYKKFLCVADINAAAQVTSRRYFVAEEAIIKDIVKHESCILIGRCGFHTLRNHPNTLRIFLCADMPDRIQNIMRQHNLTETEAIAKIKEIDKAREKYTQTFTDADRNDARNYDLAINVSKFGIDGTVDLIMKTIG